ncbi:hypothetical protein DPMN_187285 [Dreissena polymorpha]|uniref:Uncharacterized protein n=1 Tax=Dreissena polymorpha TaxID=45954 RepID=A0A9D4I8X6_DREPO|nr:hypothetical protein DPMN_187285 [Dreissena polymorpha]
MPGWSPGESRQRPGRAPVYRNSAGTHWGYTGIRRRQSYCNAPVLPRSSPRRSTVECRWRPGRAPIYRCTVAITGLCRHSPGLHLGTTGDNRGIAVALPGPVWAPVVLEFRPGYSRCRPGCFRCRAGRCRPLR